MKKRKVVPLLLITAMLVSLLGGFSPVAKAESTMTAVDASASNWRVDNLTAADVAGGASFTGTAGTYKTGAALKTALDINEAVEFELRFTKEEMAVDSLFAVTLGVDTDSFNDASKGITYIMYKKADNVIECDKKPAGSGWKEYTYASVNTFRFVKEADGWCLYLKAGAGGNDYLLGKVGFDQFAANRFTDGKATLGVYVYDPTNTTNEVAFEVTNVKHVVTGQESGEFEPVLDAYDLATYTYPYWSGDTVYNESAMIVKNRDGSIPAISLLYPATEIISVRSSDLKKVYEKGVDWDLENGSLVILDGSSIPFMTYEEYYPNSSDMATVDGRYIFFTEGNYFHNQQIAVTYKHSATWNWSIPGYKGDKLPKTVEKLKNNKVLNIVFYGDSITTGANSSSVVGAAPYAATWMTMFAESLKAKYKNTNITTVNTAVGGTASAWGVQNVQERVVSKNPDLLVLGFGMNDGNGGYVSAQEFKANINSIIQAAKAGNPDVEILLVSPMLPNPEVRMTQGNQAFYEEQLLSLETEGIAVAPVTKMYTYLMQNKRYYDMTGNNVNHPNDFVARLYAQTLNAVLIESEQTETVPYAEYTYELLRNDDYWMCVNNSSVSGGVVTLGESAIANYVESKLNNKLAKFDMEANIPVGKWIGIMLRQSEPGSSPWDQECYLILVMDTGSVQLLKYKGGDVSVLVNTQTDVLQNGTLAKTAVRAGVLTEGENARIVFDIAGKNVLDCLDSEDPIKTSGDTGFITLETATAKIYATGKYNESGSGGGEEEDKGDGSGYAGGSINPDYVTEWPQIGDYVYRGKNDPEYVHPNEVVGSIDVADAVAKIKAPGTVDVVVALSSPQIIDKSIFENLAGRAKQFIAKVVDASGNVVSVFRFNGAEMEVGATYMDFDMARTGGDTDTGNGGKNDTTGGSTNTVGGNTNTAGGNTNTSGGNTGTSVDGSGTGIDEPGTEKPGTDNQKPGTDDGKPGADDKNPGKDNDKSGTDTKKESTWKVFDIILIVAILLVLIVGMLLLLYARRQKQDMKDENAKRES